MTQDPRRRLPQVDRLVRELDADGLPRPVVVDAVRTVIARARKRKTAPEDVLDLARRELAARRARLLRPLINATGVIIHTNLGRAPLSQRAIDAVVRAASGYTNLELDLETGRRGDRYVHVEPMLAVATGADAALVVNNNAAAVLLVCAALARGREVVISRGELIEIGGEFRIPDVLAESGAVLREVGSTNRTHLRDYERAVGRETALILKVHPSNYRVVGFTKAVEPADLSTLGVPLVYDVGSGLIGRELADEPTVAAALHAGASLVCFSGDKLLGGPQAGIVVGRAPLVAKLRKHPLLRALRPDKMTLAALEETVAAYLDGRTGELPVWRMIDAPVDETAKRCRALAAKAAKAGYEAAVVQGESVAGGGSLPGHTMPSPVLRVVRADRTAKAVAEHLRARGVIARIDGRAVVLDLRTVAPPDDAALAAALED
jgi:L-seryl-tRNA(Ser) seleniumtransferase